MSPTGFSLADILIMAGNAGGGGMTHASKYGTKISARLKLVGHTVQPWCVLHTCVCAGTMSAMMVEQSAAEANIKQVRPCPPTTHSAQ